MVKDNIADFIVKVRNANSAKKTTVSFPYSKLISAIAEVLQKEGYLSSVEKKGKKGRKFVEVGLLYSVAGEPKISGVRRLSKYSRRVYEKARNLRVSKTIPGHTILSTPKGIMTAHSAKKETLGGELLFKIW